MNPELQRTLDKAKFVFIGNTSLTFITHLLYTLKLEWTDKVPAAAVDGINVFINENFWMNLSEAERVGLLWHEVWHVAYDHLSRGDIFPDHTRFNKAADYAININAAKDGITLPAGGLLDSKYANQSTEEIYYQLPPTPEDDKFDGDIISTNDPKVQAKVEKNIVAAAVAAKQAEAWSNVPSEIKVKVTKLLSPKLPWNVLLHRYVNGFANDDYSYRRPNRKYQPELYLPTLFNESLKNVSVAVDTSGSVSQKDFDAILSELKGLQLQMEPEVLKVLGFDTRIHTEVTINSATPVESLEFNGRGGTNLEEVFEWAEKEKPTIMIIFSDMHVRIPAKPSFPVMWLCINNSEFTCDYGRIVHFGT